jgi:hypothetical protein
MALVSPGVEVTVVDESNYIPAATNSVPYILVATAQNKISGAGIGVAAGTLASNAGRVYLITSQRDLAATFGVPFFYKTSDGTPINGYELNEYGLLAAYSVLGVSNRAYIQRADIDLSELTATLIRPTGSPNNDTYWLDTAETEWGMFQWNATTGAFTVQPVLAITSTTQLTGGIPSPSVGSIGDYAVVTTNSSNPIYYKTPGNSAAGVPANTWVLVGSNAWKSSWPTVQGANSVTVSLTAGNVININGTNVTVPASPDNNLDGLVAAINSASIAGVTALKDSSNRINIYGDGTSESDLSLGDGGVVDIDPALSTPGLLTTLGIVGNTYYTPFLQQSPNFTVPRWRSTDSEPRPTGSIWNMLTAVNFGANLVVKRYNATLGIFETVPVPIYASDAAANAALDPSGGGRNIPENTLFSLYNINEEQTSVSPPSGVFNNVATFLILQRTASGPTEVTGNVTTPTFVVGDTFTISASTAGTATMTTPVTATLNGTTAADFAAAVSAAAVPNVLASVTSDGSIRFTHSQGGDIVLRNVSGTPVTDAGFVAGVPGVRVPIGGTSAGNIILSNWATLTYTASAVAPDQDPASGRLWYYAATNQVDIMIQSGTTWAGYRTVSNDVRGYNLTQTDPNGPLISPTAPVQQSDTTPLVYGDLWLDTSNLEVYPALYRWENVSGVDQWVEINNTDQTTSNGILFADARWAPNGTTNPITDNIPTIISLLNSSYLDLDAPDPSLYPAGTLLFNTRRSGFNVKRFEQNWFNATRFDIPSYNNTTNYVAGDKVLYVGVVYVATASGTGNLPTNVAFWSPLQTNAWVTAAGNRNDGSPYMGRQSVRQLVVAAMRSAIDTQDTLREEQVQFNLMACPQYPELIPNMVRLNNERNNTGFVIGDTPLRLGPQGTSLIDFATNRAGLQTDSELGLVTSDPYVGVFYPSCQTSDLSGSLVVQPPSHMMLRTIVRSDEVAFPWLAPAGVRRGVVDNADRLGYIEEATGEFVTIATGQGVRDVLYENRINPITFIPGVGITNYGNKTTTAVTSALNRINVARLVAFLRGRLEEIGKTFVFEPNDQITRNEITNAITGLLNDLIAKRGIYDYLVVCDLSNNTPARIDRNELYVDIAIEPVKAVEFIYIPLRIKNTGEISSGQIASSSSV